MSKMLNGVTWDFWMISRFRSHTISVLRCWKVWSSCKIDTENFAITFSSVCGSFSWKCAICALVPFEKKYLKITFKIPSIKVHMLTLKHYIISTTLQQTNVLIIESRFCMFSITQCHCDLKYIYNIWKHNYYNNNVLSERENVTR